MSLCTSIRINAISFFFYFRLWKSEMKSERKNVYTIIYIIFIIRYDTTYHIVSKTNYFFVVMLQCRRYVFFYFLFRKTKNVEKFRWFSPAKYNRYEVRVQYNIYKEYYFDKYMRCSFDVPIVQYCPPRQTNKTI